MTLNEKVRHLFEAIIPEQLTRAAPLGEGFRCRFHVAEAGAWEIDLRRPPRCIEASSAPGGYDAVIYVSAEDFSGLMDADGASLQQLVLAGRLRATGDSGRALEMTKIVAKRPPFVWSPVLRTVPVDAAFFGAAEDDLVQALPGWRRSLVGPVMRRAKSSFTGARREVPGFEPRPGDDVEATSAPLAPPFPFAVAPITGEWWEHLLDFYVMLVADDDETRKVRDDDSLDLSEATERVFPAVFAGRAGRSNVYSTPRRLAHALAVLSDEDCDLLAANLATRVYPDSSRRNPFTGVEQDHSKYHDAFEHEARGHLHHLRDLARSLSSTQALWFWGWFE